MLKRNHIFTTQWKKSVLVLTDFCPVLLKERLFSIIRDKEFKPVNEARDASVKDLRGWSPLQSTSIQYPKKTFMQPTNSAWILWKVSWIQPGSTQYYTLVKEAVKTNAPWNRETCCSEQQLVAISTSSWMKEQRRIILVVPTTTKMKLSL